MGTVLQPLYWTPKDPDETIDYSLAWRYRVPTNDRIVASVWTVDGGDGLLLIDAYPPTFTDTTATIWLSGGTESGEYYTLTNTVDTAAGRVMQQSVDIMIVSR